MKKLKLIAFFAIVSALAFTAVGCQNIFGSKTDPESIYGDWRYLKDSGAGIDLSINPDGTYSYREFGTNGSTLYKTEGKYSMYSSRLVLRDIDEEDGQRYSVYSISMSSSPEDEDILNLVPKITAKYSFRRISAPITPISSSANKPKKVEESLPIEGVWVSPDLGTVAISAQDITIVLTDGTRLSASITAIDGSTLELSFSDSTLDTSMYSKASYFIVNNSLYVVFEALSNIPVVFTKL